MEKLRELNNVNILEIVLGRRADDSYEKCKKIDSINFDSEENFIEFIEDFIKIADYITKNVNNLLSKKIVTIEEYSKVLRILNVSQMTYGCENNEIDFKKISGSLVEIYQKISLFFKGKKFNFCIAKKIGHRYRFENFRNSMEKIEDLIVKLNGSNGNIKAYKDYLYESVNAMKINYKSSRDTVKTPDETKKQKNAGYCKIKENEYENKICYTHSNTNIGTIIATIDNKLEDETEKLARDIIEDQKFYDGGKIFKVVSKCNLECKQYERKIGKKASEGLSRQLDNANSRIEKVKDIARDEEYYDDDEVFEEMSISDKISKHSLEHDQYEREIDKKASEESSQQPYNVCNKMIGKLLHDLCHEENEYDDEVHYIHSNTNIETTIIDDELKVETDKAKKSIVRDKKFHNSNKILRETPKHDLKYGQHERKIDKKASEELSQQLNDADNEIEKRTKKTKSKGWFRRLFN